MLREAPEKESPSFSAESFHPNSKKLTNHTGYIQIHVYIKQQKQKMDNSIIIKYLQGKANNEEKTLLFEWLEKDKINKDEFFEIKKVWALTSKYKNAEGITWADIKNTGNEKTTTRFLKFRLLKQVAIFILLIGLGAVIQYFFTDLTSNKKLVYDQHLSVFAPLGQMTDLELPDGTLVKLNSGTTILYNGDFSSGNREVFIEGEAFFDVQTDKEHPFVVKSKLLDVKVYGTLFNICSYHDDNDFSATLVEGSISILDKDGNEISKLKPGDNAAYNENESNITVSQINTSLYTSWKEGLVTYRNEKMKDIARQIERWYNVEIVIQKEGLGEERYFGTILKNKPIDQILEVFKLTTSLEYEIVPRADKPTLIYWK